MAILPDWVLHNSYLVGIALVGDIKLDIMKCTAIINTHNGNASHLKAAIEGYLGQRGVEMQVIVSIVDGDQNTGLISGYPVEIATLPADQHAGHRPEGSFQQINNAIPLINHEWMMWGAGDDIPLQNKAHDEISLCLRTKKKVCYSNIAHVNEDLSVRFVSKLGVYNYQRHLAGNFVSDCSCMRTELLRKYTPFNWKKWGNFCYWDMWLRIYENEGGVFCHNSNYTWLYRPGGMSRSKRPEGYEDQRERMLDTHRNRS